MSHTHTHSPARPSREPRAGRTVRVVVVAILVVLGMATAAGLALLWPDHGAVQAAASRVQFAATGTTFPTGRIVTLSDGCPGLYSSDSSSADSSSSGAPSATAPGDTRVCQVAQVELLNGASAGRVVSVPLLWPWATAGLHAGDRLELVVPPQSPGAAASAQGELQGITVNGIVRDQSLLVWVLVFVVVVVAVGLLRGLMALVSLGFAAFMFACFLLPALVSGRPALAVAVVGGSAIMFVVLYLAHGLSIRTSAALLGTLGGIAITAGIAQLAVATTHLTGVTGDVGGTLADATRLDFRGVLTCAIVIAGLGVLNDVTVTQASAVWELRAASPGLTRRQLCARAMRIGRDHIASTIYTIAFAYAGTAMIVLIVLYLYDRSAVSLLSQDDLGSEVVRTLCSGIGLVLAVPVTTVIAVLLVPAQVASPERGQVADWLRLRWYSFMPRAVEQGAVPRTHE